MKFHKHKSYRRYVSAQRKIALRRVSEGRTHCSAEINEIQAIAEYMKGKPFERGICHGVRTGEELSRFQEHLGGEWIGTDIVKEFCDGEKILHWDFSEYNEEWVKAFDVVYSNALDHAMDPVSTLRVWIEQLRDNGRLLLQWCAWHNRLGVKGNKADCFAASFDEYDAILNGIGNVENVLEVSGGRYEYRVFVVEK